jgi:DNA-binding HxlR family transcriptional regulator
VALELGDCSLNQASSYGQFCPVAKAAEIITTRWTPLVLRELLCGARHFNEIRRGVPLMSPTLLSRRLKELEAAGVVSRIGQGGARSNTEYDLTEAGEELRPIIVALGVWGQRRVESAADSSDWDAGVLMWDMRREVDPDALPKGRTVVQFEYLDAPKELRLWWLVVEEGEVDLCQSDPGHEPDLFVTTKVRTMARVWIGKDSLARAMAADDIEVIGTAALRASINAWLKLAIVARVAGRRDA